MFGLAMFIFSFTCFVYMKLILKSIYKQGKASVSINLFGIPFLLSLVIGVLSELGLEMIVK